MFSQPVPIWINAVTTIAVLAFWLGAYLWIRRLRNDRSKSAL
jgi:hypothetical protein